MTVNLIHYNYLLIGIFQQRVIINSIIEKSFYDEIFLITELDRKYLAQGGFF